MQSFIDFKFYGVIQTFDDFLLIISPNALFSKPISELLKFYEKRYCFNEKVYQVNELLFKEFIGFRLR